MEVNFHECVDLIVSPLIEGGYSDHKDDRGGKTNYGITERTLSKVLNRKATETDVRALTRCEAMDIYRSLYWGPALCDRWPAGLDLGVFDMAVNSGVTRAVKTLQLSARVKPDGVIGPKTLKATLSTPHRHLFNDFFANRMVFYALNSQFETFGRGWSRRLMNIHDVAVQMRGDNGNI